MRFNILKQFAFSLAILSFSSSLASGNPKNTKTEGLILFGAKDNYIRGTVTTTIEGASSVTNETINYLSQAIKQKPNYAEAYFERGKQKFVLGKYEESVQDLSQAIQINPKFSLAYTRRALVYFNLEKYPLALEDLNSALEIMPEKLAFILRAKIHEYYGNNIEATTDYIEALKSKFCDADPFEFWQGSGFSDEPKYRFSSAICDHSTRSPTQEILINFSIENYHEKITDNYSYFQLYYKGLATNNSEDIKKALELNNKLPFAYLYLYLYSINNTDGKISLDKNIKVNRYKSREKYEIYQLISLTIIEQIKDDARGGINAFSPIHYLRQKYIQSLNDLNKAIKYNHNSIEVLYARGLLLSKMNQSKKSIDDFTKFLILLAEKNKDDVELIQYLQREIVLQPKTSVEYYRRGVSRRFIGDQAGAIRDFTEAIKLNAKFAKAYFQRGMISTGSRASHDLNHAIKLDPDFTTAYIGRILKLWPRWPRDIRVLNIESSIHSLYYAKCRTLIYSESINNSDSQYNSCLAYQTQAIKINPYLTDSYPLQGRSNLLPSGNDMYNESFIRQKAFDTIDELESNRTNHFDYEKYILLGQAYSDVNQLSRAKSVLNMAIKVDPKKESAFLSRSFVYHRLQENDKAIYDANRVLELNPDSSDAYYIRGFAKYEIGDNQGALIDLSNAIKLDPIFFAAYLVRGHVLKKLGDIKEAYNDYEIAGLQWQCVTGCGSGSSLSSNSSPNKFYQQGIRLKNRGDKSSALKMFNLAANIFQAQGKTSRYRSMIKVIKKLEE